MKNLTYFPDMFQMLGKNHTALKEFFYTYLILKLLILVYLKFKKNIDLIISKADACCSSNSTFIF